MISLFDELLAKLRLNPRVTARSGPRQDLGLLLFNRHEALNALWKAADRAAGSGDAASLAELRAAVDALRPLFGDRGLAEKSVDGAQRKP